MSPRIARLIGVALQAVILGTALFLAIGQLAGLQGGARLFRYQAF
jgi:hypothetical protein